MTRPFSALAAARWALFGAYLLLTVVLSSMSHPPMAEKVSDIILHSLEFCGMSVLLLQALGCGLFKRHTVRHLAGTAIFGVLYGVVDEIHQYFVPNRFSSVKDAAVDATATVATVGLFALFGRFMDRGHGGERDDTSDRRSTREKAGGGGPGESASDPPHVELLTRAGCHLCEEARGVLSDVMGRRGERFDIVDVDASAPLASRYGEEVPVVLVDGIKRFKGRVDARRLDRLLEDRARLRRKTPAEFIEDVRGRA